MTSNKMIPSKLFSDATKKQVLKARNAASNYKNEIARQLPQKHEIVLI